MGYGYVNGAGTMKSKDDLSTFVGDLANVVYTRDGIAKARSYAVSRKVDPDKFMHPWTVSSSDTADFRLLTHGPLPPHLYTDCLFIPIADFWEPSKLIGFDIRYLGNEAHRIRYRKIQANPELPLMYFTHAFDQIDHDRPVLVVEGAVDCETLRPMGFPVVSPLTAKGTPGMAMFLWALSKKILLCYDNDAPGRRSTEKLLKTVSHNDLSRSGVLPLTYSGKDPNQVLLSLGPGYFQGVLKPQIEMVALR